MSERPSDVLEQRTFQPDVPSAGASRLQGAPIIIPLIIGGVFLIIVGVGAATALLTAARLDTALLVVVSIITTITALTTILVFVHRMSAEARSSRHGLAIERKRLERAVNNLSEGLLMFDESGQLVVYNRPYLEMFGLPTNRDYYGWKLRELLHWRQLFSSLPIDIDAFCANLQQQMGQGRIVRSQRTFPDGRVIRFEHRPMPEGGWLSLIEDVTEQAAADEQLRQSQKLEAIGKLTGGVAHDFNNILTVIVGTIEILVQGVADRPELSAIARMIDDAATRGANLTQQLLAFSRKQPLEPRDVDVNALIGDVARLLRPTLGEQIEIAMRLEPDTWHAMVDASQLSTALLNLAINARDAMPKGGKLTFESGNVVLDEAYPASRPDVTPGRYTLVTVSDTGTGIPAGIRERIFEPFFTTKEVGKGTGLGLSMVYGFVTQSYGHIKVESEAEHGTTFKIYLPPSDLQDAPVRDAEQEGLPTGNETILVVEDDDLVREFVLTRLDSLGYTTVPARDAASALDLVDRGTEFDLIFTDVIMPGGMSGRQLVDEIKKRRPDIKVLYTSGYAEHLDFDHGRLEPGVALLAKPYRKDDLARRIREAMAV